MYLFSGWNDYLASLLEIDSSSKSYNDAHMIFWEYLIRKIPRKAREVVFPKNFEVPKEIAKGFELFCSNASLGGDLAPYMSKGTEIYKFEMEPDGDDVMVNRTVDGLFNHWNIRHFHLGMKMKGRYIERSGPLLYAIVTEDKIYAIAIMEHGAWVDKNLLTIVKDNWPELIDDNKVVNADYSEETQKELRKRGTSSVVDLTENQYLFGTTLSGHKMSLPMAYTYLIRYFTIKESELSKYLVSKYPFIFAEPKLVVKDACFYIKCDKTGYKEEITHEVFNHLSRAQDIIINL
ncbi:hypothetical protein C7Y70_13125 [Pseudoalteromonas sp. KS88]|uniref:hypothetical protein n=1 Tax=Pseudoalteromonas sp. KS88 TaxID=2109918 RepID=UPI001081D4F5|nr:hypothetical protein [Pseudoalteromonas sp. KS88]TGE81343.1 hypothetical protein C7Y70_13125 [Pseudoalteromonas sp. KS88]